MISYLHVYDGKGDHGDGQDYSIIYACARCQEKITSKYRVIEDDINDGNLTPEPCDYCGQTDGGA